MAIRPFRAIRDLDRRLDEAHAADRAAQEWARFELARSATRYTRRTRKVVDDTMSLTATLMRAGEVYEASRLMEEVEEQVRTEEAALIERVNEVKAAEMVRKRKLNRLKVAKTLATAFLSGGMFIFSAFGVAVAKYLVTDDPRVVPPTQTQDSPQIKITLSGRSIEVAPGVELKLTPAEFKEFTRIARSGDEGELTLFLAGHLSPEVLERVQAVLLTAVADLDVPDLQLMLREAVRDEAESAPAESSPEPSDSPQPSSEPSDEESSSPEPSPDSEPEPSPSGGEEQESGGQQNSTPTPQNLPTSDILDPEG